MSERLKSMQRIVAVQAQRKALAEWKLAEIETRRAALTTAQTELGGFVQASNLAGPLAGLALKQGQRLAERQALAEREHAGQRATVQAAERRHRLAERMMDAVAAETRMLVERRSLDRIIEDAVAREQTTPAD